MDSVPAARAAFPGKLRAVRIRVMLAGFFRVMRGVDRVAMRHMRVVAGLAVVAGFVMIGRRPVVRGGMFVVLGCFAMVICGFLRHGMNLGSTIQADCYGRITGA